jgi:hypothetical protein
MAKDMLFGDRNEITITRSCDINGEHYLPFDKVIVSAEHARKILEENVGELTSMAWDKGLSLNGPSTSIRK